MKTVTPQLRLISVSPLELAQLAATLRRGHEAPSVNHALQLLQDSCEALQFHEYPWQAGDEATRASEDIACPDRFPATLDDILVLIVRGKTPADRMKKFRDFQRYRIDREWGPNREGGEPALERWKADVKEVGKVEFERRKEILLERRMNKYSRDGIIYEWSWISLSEDYLRWFRDCKSAKARESAKARKRLTRKKPETE